MSNGDSGNFSGSAVGPVLGSTIGEGVGHYKSKLAWSRTKRMMQKRHQWEVNDLRAAGLNPILSAGAAPSMGSPQQSGDQGWGTAGAASTETERKRTMDKASRLNLSSQRSQIEAAIRHLNAQTSTEGSKQDMNTANAESIRANTARWSGFSAAGGKAGEITRSVTSGDVWQGAKSVMGGNADAAVKFMNEISREVQALKQYLKDEGYVNEKWSDNRDHWPFKRSKK